jgi:hypothetical protein
MTTKFDTKEFLESPYWEAVKLCLMEFHGYDESRASDEVLSYEHDIAKTMKNPFLVFHEEPFHLACNLSNHQLELSEFREEYDSLLAKVQTK